MPGDVYKRQDTVRPGFGLRLVEGDAQRRVLAAAIDDDVGALTGFEVLDCGIEIGVASDGLAADFGDYIAGSQPRFLGASAGFDVVHIGNQSRGGDRCLEKDIGRQTVSGKGGHT